MSAEDESEKTKVWLLTGLQKIEDRDYVRVSSYLWMLLLVIYTSEMLTTWILLSGIKWVKLIFNYSQVWNVFTRWLFSVDSFRTERMTPWDDTFIKLVINVNNRADLWSRSKKSETKFNECCARDWKCKPMNKYIVSTSNVYSHKFHSDRQA